MTNVKKLELSIDDELTDSLDCYYTFEKQGIHKIKVKNMYLTDLSNLFNGCNSLYCLYDFVQKVVQNTDYLFSDVLI